MELFLFKYEEANHFNDLRTVEIDGEIWFVGSDVTSLLGYANSRQSLATHCKEKGVQKRDIPTKSGTQSMTLINEPNVYRLIVKSRLPSAEKFETWLFEEVLPSIRKKGHYAAGIDRTERPDFIIRYMENFDHVKKGYFSVINQLYIDLYARLEHAGYQIPNRGIDGKKMRPDISVGLGFCAFVRGRYPELENEFIWYNHTFTDINKDVEAKQWPNTMLHIFIEYIDDVWIPQNASLYFKKRDLKALDFLPKLLR